MKQKQKFLLLSFLGVFLLGTFAALSVYQKNPLHTFQASNIFTSEDSEFSANAAIVKGKLTLETRIKPASEDMTKGLHYYIAAKIPGKTSDPDVLYFLTSNDNWIKYDSKQEFSIYAYAPENSNDPLSNLAGEQYIRVATDQDITSPNGTNLIGTEILAGYKAKENGELKYHSVYIVSNTIPDQNESAWDLKLITAPEEIFYSINEIQKFGDTAWIENIITAAAQKEPGLAIDYADQLVTINRDWAMRLLDIAIPKRPTSAAGNIRMLLTINESWGRQLFPVIAKEYSSANFWLIAMDVIIEFDEKYALTLLPLAQSTDSSRKFAFQWSVMYFQKTKELQSETATPDIKNMLITLASSMSKNDGLYYLQRLLDLDNNSKQYFSEKEWNTLMNISILLQDPAAAWMKAVPAEMVKPWTIAQFPDFTPLQLQYIVGRNLFLSGVSIPKDPLTDKPITFTKEVIDQILSDLQNQQNKYKDTPIFKDRNVLLLANPEKWPTTIIRFGNYPTQTAIKAQINNGTFNVIRPGDKISLNEGKKSALAAIKDARTDKPFTLIFDGHGTPDQLLFSDDVTLTLDELAAALIVRYENLSPVAREDIIKNPDILIFASCDNHTFLRALYDELKKNWQEKSALPLPITIGMSEYGQLSFNDRSPYGSDFFTTTFQFATPGHITIFEDIIKGKNKQKDSIPSVYFPFNGNPNQFLGK